MIVLIFGCPWGKGNIDTCSCRLAALINLYGMGCKLTAGVQFEVHVSSVPNLPYDNGKSLL